MNNPAMQDVENDGIETETDQINFGPKNISEDLKLQIKSELTQAQKNISP